MRSIHYQLFSSSLSSIHTLRPLQDNMPQVIITQLFASTVICPGHVGGVTGGRMHIGNITRPTAANNAQRVSKQSPKAQNNSMGSISMAGAGCLSSPHYLLHRRQHIGSLLLTLSQWRSQTRAHTGLGPGVSNAKVLRRRVCTATCLCTVALRQYCQCAPDCSTPRSQTLSCLGTRTTLVP